MTILAGGCGENNSVAPIYTIRFVYNDSNNKSIVVTRLSSSDGVQHWSLKDGIEE